MCVSVIKISALYYQSFGMKHTRPTISIIFPTHNGGSEPIDFLTSLEAQKYPHHKIEVIMVDNNSTDGSITSIRKKFPFVTIIKNKNNRGFSSSINQGLALAHGAYLCIANDDSVFEPSCIVRVLDYFEKNPSVGIVGGAVYRKSNQKKLVSAGYFFNFFTGNIKPNTDINSLTTPDWIEGCGLFFNRSVFARIGFFDEGYPYYFEDFDYCVRARAAGFKVMTLPQVLIWHGGSTSANKQLKQKYYYWYKSKLRFIIKHLPIGNVFSILLFLSGAVLTYRTLLLNDGRLIPYTHALWSTIIALKEILRARALREEVYIPSKQF